jgi:hypothetical protein
MTNTPCLSYGGVGNAGLWRSGAGSERVLRASYSELALSAPPNSTIRSTRTASRSTVSRCRGAAHRASSSRSRRPARRRAASAGVPRSRDLHRERADQRRFAGYLEHRGAELRNPADWGVTAVDAAAPRTLASSHAVQWAGPTPVLLPGRGGRDDHLADRGRAEARRDEDASSTTSPPPTPKPTQRCSAWPSRWRRAAARPPSWPC